MGRYYEGDISGKFWFAIQSSNAADRFGVIGEEDEELAELYGGEGPLCYSFGEEHLPLVIEEIELIEKGLGNKKELLDEYFANNVGHNSNSLQQFFDEKNITVDSVEDIIKEYADLEFGYKIKNCIEDIGTCTFEAEL